MNYELSLVKYELIFGQLGGTFQDHSGIIPGSFQDHSGIILGSFRDHSGVIPGSFGDHCGVILACPHSEVDCSDIDYISL